MSEFKVEDVNPKLRFTSSEVDKLIAQAQLQLFEWVKVDHYILMHPTETLDAIKKRIQRKKWILGVHAKRSDSMGWMVNLVEVKKLIESGQLRA